MQLVFKILEHLPYQRYFDFRQPPNITCYGSSMALLRVFPVLPTLPNVSVLALFV